MASNETAQEELRANFESLHLPRDEEEKLKDWIRSSKRRIEILITGRTGTGKSTLVNALIGKDVAGTGSNLAVTTKHVTGHTVKAGESTEIVVWDSPGLQDGSGEEDEYLTQMRENCKDIDIIIYCIDVSAGRAQLQGAEVNQMKDLCAIKQLTANFGTNCWEHSIFVLTRANALETSLKVKDNPEKIFQDRLKDWEKRIHAALSKEGVPIEIANQVPVKPAGYPKKPHLLGHQYWLSELWFAFMKNAKNPSQPTITRVNQHRFQKENETTTEDFKKEGHEQPIISDTTWDTCPIEGTVTIGFLVRNRSWTLPAMY
ncbi:GTPase Era [Geodia barretti]|uniref:GTPase Era n=1 Tax=Geodia barretti TaxID=519541 RepID=A0AA35X364_GEOBA|nr:GTPase Era [Geodia barretti]